MALALAAARNYAPDVHNLVRPDCLKSEEILKAFNTWAFKREQPSNIELSKISCRTRCLRQRATLVRWLLGQREPGKTLQSLICSACSICSR